MTFRETSVYIHQLLEACVCAEGGFLEELMVIPSRRNDRVGSFQERDLQTVFGATRKAK